MNENIFTNIQSYLIELANYTVGQLSGRPIEQSPDRDTQNALPEEELSKLVWFEYFVRNILRKTLKLNWSLKQIFREPLYEILENRFFKISLGTKSISRKSG